MMVIAGLCAFGLIAELARVQAFPDERLLAKGESQRIRSIEIAGGRGRILDRTGAALAVSLPTPTLAADPRLMVDPVGTAQVLAPLVGVEETTLAARFTRPDSKFAYVARQVTPEVAAAVAELELPGIYSYEESARFNPLGDEFARSILGRVNTDHEGISGLEAVYGKELEGEPGKLVVERSRGGTAIPGGVYELDDARHGADLQISIDRTLQFETERLLIDQVGAANADGGVVIIMDPKTGEVLAMASVGRNAAGEPVAVGENKALTWMYEPGSVMKPITFAGVFEEGLAELGTFNNVPYQKTIYDKDFTDDHFHHTEWWTPVDIMRESSNIGTIQWAEELGATRLHETLVDFGFGQPTSLRFPFQEKGLLSEVDSWSGTSLPSISIGQGIAATPMQVIQSFNIIATGGVYVPPKLVLGTTGPNGELREPPYEPSRRVISEDTAVKLIAAMEAVVTGGTGTSAGIPGYTTVGKTGTSWKPQPGGGYQDPDGNFHYVATFGGFLPAEDPSVSILVVIDEPRGDESEISGGKAAAPLFAKLSRYVLQHLRIPPSTINADIDGEKVRTETALEATKRKYEEAIAKTEEEKARAAAEEAAAEAAAQKAEEAEDAQAEDPEAPAQEAPVEGAEQATEPEDEPGPAESDESSAAE